MKTVGQKIEPFKVIGVKPGFNRHEENGESAFETITEQSFPGKWKVIYFYPKDFTFVCPTEIVGFAKLAQDFADRDAVRARRLDRQRVQQARLAPRPQGPARASTTGSSPTRPARSSTSSACATAQEGVALRATFIVDPDNVIQHVSVNNLNVGRNPEEILRVLDGLQTDELCPCNRDVGGDAQGCVTDPTPISAPASREASECHRDFERTP